MTDSTSYAIVTGAAAGMGREYVRQLSAAGMGVVAVDIDADGLDRLSDEIPGTLTLALDLTREDAAAEIGRFVRQRGLLVDFLVNNAGMLFTTEVADTDPARLRAMMMLHCVTPLLLCREFLPEMKERGRGRMLCISSICAWMDWPAIGMYGNTKRFVKGMARSLRLECRGTGVSVTTAIFGAVDTSLFGFSEKTRAMLRRCGLMISPETAVGKAIEAASRGRATTTPGLLNKLAVPVVSLLSDRTLAALYRRFRHLLN